MFYLGCRFPVTRVARLGKTIPRDHLAGGGIIRLLHWIKLPTSILEYPNNPDDNVKILDICPAFPKTNKIERNIKFVVSKLKFILVTLNSFTL